jgi:predicted dehydrogenase
MLKVAIIGCGKIADAHAAQLLRVPDCQMVAVCDREILMAKQLWERFPIQSYFDDLNRLLEESRPDVVHITTSPESHSSIATQCLEAGCHVYVEKPFVLYERDAHAIINLADSRGLLVTAGHDDQFSHVARRMRALIDTGYLGGRPVHMESYYCYEFGSSAYANALLSDKSHWVRRLPGKLLHNIISHGIARIAEHLTSDSPTIRAWGKTSAWLRESGENEIIDELRVFLDEPEGASAYFTFSSQMRPSLHQFRIYGSRNGLLLDQDQETLIRLSGRRPKSYLEKFGTPANLAKQYCENVLSNAKLFMAGDFHMKSGMKCLIERFYAAITKGEPLPIPYREIILTAKIMDSIFSQLQAETRGTDERESPYAALATDV